MVWGSLLLFQVGCFLLEQVDVGFGDALLTLVQRQVKQVAQTIQVVTLLALGQVYLARHHILIFGRLLLQSTERLLQQGLSLLGNEVRLKLEGIELVCLQALSVVNNTWLLTN